MPALVTSTRAAAVATGSPPMPDGSGVDTETTPVPGVPGRTVVMGVSLATATDTTSSTAASRSSSG